MSYKRLRYSLEVKYCIKCKNELASIWSGHVNMKLNHKEIVTVTAGWCKKCSHDRDPGRSNPEVDELNVGYFGEWKSFMGLRYIPKSKKANTFKLFQTMAEKHREYFERNKEKLKLVSL